MLTLLDHGIDPSLLACMGTQVEEVRELFGLEGIAASDAPQLCHHLVEVLVD